MTFHATADVVVIVVAINLSNNLRKDKITCGRGIHSH